MLHRDRLPAKNEPHLRGRSAYGQADDEMPCRAFRGEPRWLRRITGRQIESTAQLARADAESIPSCTGRKILA